MSSPRECFWDAATCVLVIEDDARLCGLIQEYLEPLGYAVSLAHTGARGLEMALSGEFQAIILDVMLPGMNGFEVLRRLRVHSTVPVLMLTGRGEEADRIAGLEMGADCYLPKTSSSRELLARLRSVLRRRRLDERAEHTSAPLIIGELSIDPATRVALLRHRALALTQPEFDLLWSLGQAAGRVKSREQLLIEATGDDFEGFARSIDLHISSLRNKLGDDAVPARWIETVTGVGYMLKKPEVI